jgi:hypothetical protein
MPLARQALALVRDLHKLTGHSRHLFPGRESARTMSENTMRDALNALDTRTSTLRMVSGRVRPPCSMTSG